ncbi:hypothetical protein F5880DRAFT_1505004 [Lentinula raphanica]|nr:hypothetical protein F5880DRAFT_1505004 [Lentinula raphanica]
MLLEVLAGGCVVVEGCRGKVREFGKIDPLSARSQLQQRPLMISVNFPVPNEVECQPLEVKRLGRNQDWSITYQESCFIRFFESKCQYVLQKAFLLISTTAHIPLVISTIVASQTATATDTNPSSSGTSSSHHELSPGTIAGVVIGGLLAGFVVGGCIVAFILVVQRRLRQRRSAVRTQPEERLMHLGVISLAFSRKRMRGETAPPLRETFAIQSLPPSKNIRVLNWLARTRNAGPPSVAQRTMSERSAREDHRSATSIPLPDSTSQSHYSQPSVEPHRSNTQRSSSTTVVRPTQSNSRTSFIAMDNGTSDNEQT